MTKIYTKRSFFKVSQETGIADLDLEIYKGEVFGFLGPNGAGKTTTLNMLVGLSRPTSGRIELFGQPFGDSQPSILCRLGYVPEVTDPPGYMTVFEFLDFTAQIFFIDGKKRKEKIRTLLEEVGLSKIEYSLLRKLSMGQRRLVDFIQALINDPELILLDEPMVYLDPIALKHFRRMLLSLKEAGKTIFISTQMLSEIEKSADRLAVINEGRLLKVASKKAFIGASSMEEEFFKIIRGGRVA